VSQLKTRMGTTPITLKALLDQGLISTQDQPLQSERREGSAPM
jgi:hypothetical protein